MPRLIRSHRTVRDNRSYIASIASLGGTSNPPSMSLDFVNGVYKRNGITFANWAAFLAATSSTFTRSTIGYDIAASTQFAINTARITSVGLLYEVAATNLTLQSGFGGASWSATGGTLTANAATGPDGTSDAGTFVEDVSFGNHRILQGLTKAASSLSYAFSCYIKSTTRRFDFGIFNNAFTNGFECVVDVINGNVLGVASSFTGSGFSVGTITITPVGGGFYRVVVPFTTDASASNTYLLSNDSGTGTGARNTSYTGGGPSTGITYFNPQIEQSVGATSAIPTAGATATRGADLLTVNSVPNGLGTAVFTFTDNSTQSLSVSANSIAPSPGALNLSGIKSVNFLT